MNKTTLVKQYIVGKEILVCPIVYDSLSAKLAEKAGFKVIGVGGHVDVLEKGTPEVVLQIAGSVDVPVIVDLDNGGSDVRDVIRWVRGIEKAGVSAWICNDNGISIDDMASKVKAAVDTRLDENFVIAVKTDIRNIDDSIERANLYFEKGADLVIFEGQKTMQEMLRITTEVNGPTAVDVVPEAKVPTCGARKLQDIGFAAVTYSSACISVSVKAAQRFFKYLYHTGTTEGFEEHMVDFDELKELIGYQCGKEASSLTTEKLVSV